jgi:hypothetical protein
MLDPKTSTHKNMAKDAHRKKFNNSELVTLKEILPIKDKNNSLQSREESKD